MKLANSGKLKVAVLLLCVLIISSCCNQKEKSLTGVWVSDKAELLLTHKVLIYFEKVSDGEVMACVKVDSIAEDCCRFRADTIIRTLIPENFQVEHLTNGDVNVNGLTLVKAEDIEMCDAYDMTPAQDSTSIGERLTEWRLGSTVGVDSVTKDIAVEVNTSRNMFIYYIVSGMYYLRAARIENVDEGTLFYQNIRLMKNPNTTENTVYFSPNNKTDVLGELKINPDGFVPDKCYFDPNGGIYWSYTSHTPDQIILNGCSGDTYYINRRTVNDGNMFEWIKYK